ncbi:cilia- and flagella-associated protein 52 [Tribolium madens]|uniref:cilia- and flagella-associated protein 52 n=1 Tax=Tribolium madens TaxID=41895 RepID=UPI001CF76670|nr:cilia- and flagella-associated protein 52 [Tribolium madens]
MSDEELEGDIGTLEIKGIIGFDGTTVKGFIVHPDEKHVVYPLGNKVTIQDWTTKAQVFLSGHTNTISAIDVSRSGKYIASGQINHIGFKARVIIWDFASHTIVSQHELHKVRVEAVAFSNNDNYLFSIGGRDCGSLVVWDVTQGQVICGSAVAHGIQGEATTILSMNRRGPCFMTAGDNHLAVWTVDKEARKVHSLDVSTGKIKRTILCMDVNERDEVCYCGTATGDVLKIRLNYHHDPDVLIPAKHPMTVGCFTRISKKKLPEGKVDLYSLGVKSIRRLFAGPLLIGAGDGTLELVEEIKSKGGGDKGKRVKVPSVPTLRCLKSTNVFSAVTSLQLLKNDTVILAGTINCEIYQIDMATFNTELLVTCHTSTIYDIAFPYNFSEVFATASKNDVRVWSIKTHQELLRIQVPNFSASSVVFSHDGKSILTAWNDGIIRSFTPLTGRLIYAILNAHNKGVSALAITHEGDVLVSGGCEGQVRMWSVTPYRQQLICTLKEHKAPVSAVDINKAGTEAVSASTDGTCIIWDLIRQCRRHIMFGTTLFMCARYYPTDVQVLTGGSDRKLSYWEVLDGTLVREVEGSESGAINALDISLDGNIFVTGGNDQIVKLWNYQLGIATHIGIGHSAVITATRFSPDQKYIVTTSGSGSIFIWKSPQDLVQSSKDKIVEGAEPPKEQKVETKDEVIQDLPTARSDHSREGEKKCVCQCPCTKKPVYEHTDGMGDGVKSPEPKACTKNDSSEKKNGSVNASPKSSSSGKKNGSVTGSGRKN